MPDPREILRYCSSLVAIVTKVPSESSDAKEQVKLQLAHFSVQEYLTSDRVDASFAEAMQEATARVSMAQVYLAYLLHFDRHKKFDNIITDFPLARRSAKSWMDNATVAKAKDIEVANKLEQLFNSQNAAYDIS